MNAVNSIHTRDIIIDTTDEPWLNFRSELHLKHDKGYKCEWIVRAWAREDKAKSYEKTFTSYRKAWKAYDRAIYELERRYDWKFLVDMDVFNKAQAKNS